MDVAGCEGGVAFVVCVKLVEKKHSGKLLGAQRQCAECQEMISQLVHGIPTWYMPPVH